MGGGWAHSSSYGGPAHLHDAERATWEQDATPSPGEHSVRILLTWKCVSALACGNCETESLISNLVPYWNCPDPWLERDTTLMVDSSLSIPFLNFARNYVPFEKPDIFVFLRGGGRFFSLFFPLATLGDSGHICLSVKER